MNAGRAEDLVEIDALLRRYADIATRRAWDEFATIVLPAAPVTFTFGGGDRPAVELEGPEGLGRLGAAGMRGFGFYLYVPLNSVVDLGDDPDRATGRAYALERALDLDGNWLDIHGEYDDEFVRADGVWMIAGRRYRELHRRVTGPA